jgi:4-carboxymuconolactone decarboxylase
MARLPYAEIPERTPKLNIFRLLANADTVFKPFMRYGLALLRDTTVDPVVREQAILRVAALTPGADEWVQHEAIGRAVGMPGAGDGDRAGGPGRADRPGVHRGRRSLTS